MSAVAFALVLTAAVCHAAWNVVAHGVSRIGAPFLWWGAVASTVIWAVAIPFTGGIGPSGWWGITVGILVSGVLHVVYMLVLQAGYARGRLSTVYATARGTGPAVSAGLAILILGERPPALALVGVAVIVAGVVAIGAFDRSASARVPGERRRLDPGIVFGLLTGVAIATYTIWDAFAVRTWEVPPVAYMVGCTLVEIPFYTAMVWRRRAELRTVARAHWPRILTFGVLSPLSYILILAAVTIAPVALVAPVREVSVVLVALFGAFVLKEGATVGRVVAAVVVVCGIALLAV